MWHFDLLEMAWHQPKTHIVGLMHLSHLVLWMIEIIFLNEIACIMIQISLKSVFKSSIEMTSTLGWGIAWCWIGNKQLLEPRMTWFTAAYIHASMSLNDCSLYRYEYDYCIMFIFLNITISYLLSDEHADSREWMSCHWSQYGLWGNGAVLCYH